MSTLPKSFISEEKYLELDRAAEYKSEYYDGEMFAMPGAGMAHNQIVFNTSISVGTQLRGKPCQGLPSDMRVRIGSAARYAYPDLTVVCGKPEVLDPRKDILTNPTVVIEVLSPSTADFDRSFKFVAYTAIPRSASTS
jgi:Uma2 family endonuclease